MSQAGKPANDDSIRPVMNRASLPPWLRPPNWKRDRERPRSRRTESYRSVPTCHPENRLHRRWSPPARRPHPAFSTCRRKKSLSSDRPGTRMDSMLRQCRAELEPQVPQGPDPNHVAARSARGYKCEFASVMRYRYGSGKIGEGCVFRSQDGGPRGGRRTRATPEERCSQSRKQDGHHR